MKIKKIMKINKCYKTKTPKTKLTKNTTHTNTIKITIITTLMLTTTLITQNNTHSQTNETTYKQNVVLLANKLVGKKYKRFRYKNKSFRGDCSGFVQFIFETQKRTLLNPYIQTTKNNSIAHKLFLSFKNDNKTSFHKNNIPKPADIIFFHNTYDQNKNGKIDELNTHVGIVTKINTKTGTIHFVHYLNKQKGIKKDKINLKEPNSIEKNSFIRNKKKYPHPQKYYLTGQLFAYFATVSW